MCTVQLGQTSWAAQSRSRLPLPTPRVSLPIYVLFSWPASRVWRLGLKTFPFFYGISISLRKFCLEKVSESDTLVKLASAQSRSSLPLPTSFVFLFFFCLLVLSFIFSAPKKFHHLDVWAVTPQGPTIVWRSVLIIVALDFASASCTLYQPCSSVHWTEFNWINNLTLF